MSQVKSSASALIASGILAISAVSGVAASSASATFNPNAKLDPSQVENGCKSTWTRTGYEGIHKYRYYYHCKSLYKKEKISWWD